MIHFSYQRFVDNERKARHGLGATPIRLDPGSIGLLARIGAELRTKVFVDDEPDAAERMGFDRPTFELELSGPNEQAVTLLSGT